MPSAIYGIPNLTRPLGFTLDGGGKKLTTGKITGFQTSVIPAKITAWSIGVDQGTATVQVWKIATGTAIPTAANSISISGVSISSGTYIRSTTLTDFKTTVIAVDDIFSFNLSAVAGSATQLTFTLEIAPQ